MTKINDSRSVAAAINDCVSDVMEINIHKKHVLRNV